MTVSSEQKAVSSKKRMTRRLVVFVCLLLTVFLPVVLAGAQQPKKVFRMGVLALGNSATESPRIEAILQSLRDLGYIKGQNFAVEYRYAERNRDRLGELATELARLKVDVILASGGDGVTRAAMNATKTIPIVMVGQGFDPVTAGVIESLARPGGNVTGLTNLNIELGGKRLELLKEAIPKLVRVAVLYEQASSANVVQVKEVLPPAARALKLTLRSWDVKSKDGFERVFADLNKERPHGLYVTGGPLMLANAKRIAAFALNSRLPSMHVNRQIVEAGGLMSYGTDAADSYRRVAYFVDKILKGARPGELPIEQPTKFELVINLKTAKQIGLTFRRRCWQERTGS
jgi:putative ABC transport system substrate-binding protein